MALSDVLVLAEPMLLRIWKSSRLTLGHLRVLRALRDQPRSAGELATLTGTTRPAMARMLARLEERGLLSRSIQPSDRRRIEVCLTPDGADLLNTSRVFGGSHFQRAAALMREPERAELVVRLNELVELVREESDESRGALGAPDSDAVGAGR